MARGRSWWLVVARGGSCVGLETTYSQESSGQLEEFCHETY